MQWIFFQNILYSLYKKKDNQKTKQQPSANWDIDNIIAMFVNIIVNNIEHLRSHIIDINKNLYCQYQYGQYY